MEIIPSDKVLGSGVVFEVKGTEEPETGKSLAPIAYVVRGFKDYYGRFAEVGGQNRDEILVSLKDIPHHTEVSKWNFELSQNQLNGAQFLKIIDALRENLSNLRIAQKISDASVYFNSENSDFEVSVRFSTGLFSMAIYELLEGGKVLPAMSGLDVGHLGVVGEELLQRGEGLVSMSFDPRVAKMRLNQESVSLIHEFGKKYGIFFPGVYESMPIFAQGNFPSVSNTSAYMDDGNENKKVFPDFNAAHAAVLKLHESFSEQQRDPK